MIWRWGWAREGNSHILCSGCETCHHLWLPYLCIFALTHAQHQVFSLTVKHSWSWGMGKIFGCSALVRVVPPDFMTLSHPVPLPTYAYIMTITQQVFSPGPVWIVNVKWEKVWFQGFCARCCLDVVKVAFCLLVLCCFMEKTDFLQSLILVWSLTLHAILQPFCNDRYDC